MTTSENIGQELASLLVRAARRNESFVVKKVTDLPRRFLLEAIRFYPSVLNVRTGRLRQSFATVGRAAGPNAWEVGLSSAVEYAAIQHYGGRTAPRTIRPRRKKALDWPGADHPVASVEHPGSQIRPKFFFRDPMMVVIERATAEIKEGIGF